MRSVRLVTICLPALALMAGVCVSAQAGGGDWQKSYPVSGKASVTLSTGDSSVELRSCGECHAVRVGVEWRDRKPGDFDLNELQSGDHVSFELKEKPHLGIRFSMGNTNFHEPRVTVETPASLDLDATTSDGGLKVSGVQGNLQLHTSDGAVDIEDVSGTLRLRASDGSIKIHNVTGTLESRSSDGHATIDGKFTALQVHTSDGNLDLTVGEGSQLASASRIESSDGHVTVRLPRTLAADLDVHTGDGKINCELPLTMEGYNSAHGSGHNLHGHLNAGGVPLTIHTSDGSVEIGSL
jgi:Putative adhesin